MSEKLSAKILNLFSSAATVRDDIDNDVAVVMPLGVETDRRNREEIERKIEEMGAHYLCHESNRVRRLDGREFQRAA